MQTGGQTHHLLVGGLTDDTVGSAVMAHADLEGPVAPDSPCRTRENIAAALDQ